MMMIKQQQQLYRQHPLDENQQHIESCGSLGLQTASNNGDGGEHELNEAADDDVDE